MEFSGSAGSRVIYAEYNDSLPASVLVIGLGNPILGDDGVGWCIADRITELLSHLQPTPQNPTRPSSISSIPRYEVDCLSLGGLSLMERILGYEQVILIDAIATGENPPGTVVKLPLSDLPNRAYGHLSSAHDTTLQNALQVAQTMGAKIPSLITVIGIEIIPDYNFSQEISPPVMEAIPKAIDVVMELFL
jgi:hydrogenase maturation protease